MPSAQRKELIINLLWFAFVIGLICTVDSALADPGYDNGEKFKEVVLTEELIAHIQIAVSIDDIFKIDLFRPDVAKRLAAKVNAVALLIQELRAFRAGDASRHKGEGISRHRRMPVGLKRELRAAAEADHRSLEVAG